MSAEADAEQKNGMYVDPDDEELIQKQRQGRREYKRLQNIYEGFFFQLKFQLS